MWNFKQFPIIYSTIYFLEARNFISILKINKTRILYAAYHWISNLLTSLVGKERRRGRCLWLHRSGINMRHRLTTFQLWSEWIILWSLMKIIINYFREQEGQCKWKSHNIYPIPIDYARVEFWKINLDTLKRSSPILLLTSNLSMCKKKNTYFFFTSVCACLQMPIRDRSPWNVQSTQLHGHECVYEFYQREYD